MRDQHDIIRRIRQGETELFRLLVERHQGPLLSFIHSFTRDRLLTEDIGQAVFVSFFQYLDRFDETDPTPVAAWLFAAARNLTINVLKKERRYVAMPEESEQWPDNRPEPCSLLVASEDKALLYEAIEALSEPYREVLVASLQGRSIEEIARKTMVVPGTVKSRLSRAREKLMARIRAELAR